MSFLYFSQEEKFKSIAGLMFGGQLRVVCLMGTNAEKEGCSSGEVMNLPPGRELPLRRAKGTDSSLLEF